MHAKFRFVALLLYNCLLSFLALLQLHLQTIKVIPHLTVNVDLASLHSVLRATQAGLRAGLIQLALAAHLTHIQLMVGL